MGSDELLSLFKDLLLDINKDMSRTASDIAAIKVDLKEHMRRTNIIEAELKWVHRQIWIAHGAIALIGLVATVIAILRYVP